MEIHDYMVGKMLYGDNWEPCQITTSNKTDYEVRQIPASDKTDYKAWK